MRKVGERDVAGERRCEAPGLPRSSRMYAPGPSRRSGGRSRRRWLKSAQRVSGDEGDQRGAETPPGDRDVERGDRVGRRVEKLFRSPDRPNRHAAAKDELS